MPLPEIERCHSCKMNSNTLLEVILHCYALLIETDLVRIDSPQLEAGNSSTQHFERSQTDTGRTPTKWI